MNPLFSARKTKYCILCVCILYGNVRSAVHNTLCKSFTNSWCRYLFYLSTTRKIMSKTNLAKLKLHWKQRWGVGIGWGCSVGIAGGSAGPEGLGSPGAWGPSTGVPCPCGCLWTHLVQGGGCDRVLWARWFLSESPRCFSQSVTWHFSPKALSVAMLFVKGPA